MAWAKERGYVVVTHDLDFGAILAATEASFPSVVQVRTLNVSPESIGPKLADLIEIYRKPLEEGALILLDDAKVRVKILPLRRQDLDIYPLQPDTTFGSDSPVKVILSATLRAVFRTIPAGGFGAGSIASGLTKDPLCSRAF